jgi:SagB-type dehydrogenase family enzyme
MHSHDRRRVVVNRRVFMGQVVSFGLGLLALGNGRISWAKGLPSDPEGTTIGSAGPHLIALPPFEKNSGFALEKALVERKSVRSYNPDRKLSREEISRLLWAADGANRTDGRRTAPSARAKYPVDVLVALPEGVYLYEPKEHRMKRVLQDDIRGAIPTQEKFKNAAMMVLFVINKDRVPDVRMEWADIEIGCIGQNIFLEAAALGLGSCIFAGVAYDRVTKAIGLSENQVLRIAQAVGAAK